MLQPLSPESVCVDEKVLQNFHENKKTRSLDSGCIRAFNKSASATIRRRGRRRSRFHSCHSDFNIQPYILKFALLLIWLCIKCTTNQNRSTLAVPSIFAQAVAVPSFPAKIRLWPDKHAFTWEASVDAVTGIASSREVTLARPKSFLHRQLHPTKLPSSSTTKHRQQYQKQQLWSSILSKLEHYPQWFARVAVTFGLLRAVNKHHPSGGKYYECSLNDRFFGISFLTFGKPKHQYQTTTRQTRIIESNGAKNKSCKISDCTVVLPIVGGILVANKYRDAGPEDKSKTKQNFGYLRFTVQQNVSLQETRIITELCNYTPALVGTKEPPPFHRKALYLSTQSLVHAYIMYRFHHYCIHSQHLVL